MEAVQKCVYIYKEKINLHNNKKKIYVGFDSICQQVRENKKTPEERKENKNIPNTSAQ